MVVLMQLGMENELPAEVWKEDAVITLHESLWNVASTYEIHGGGTETDSRIASAAVQNQDAQAQPLSSRDWAVIAKDLSPGFTVGTSSKESAQQVLRCEIALPTLNSQLTMRKM